MNIFLKSIVFLSFFGLSPQLVAMNGGQQNGTGQQTATQFEREQDSKRQSARANADAENRALIQELKPEEALSGSAQEELRKIARDHRAMQSLTDYLHASVFTQLQQEKVAGLPDLPAKNILEFCWGDPIKLKFIANNMDRLIPAVVRWNHHVFDRIADAKMFLRNCKMIILTDGDRHISNEIKSPALYPDFKTKSDAFVGYQLPTKKIIFKVCPSKFKLLENLSLEQLQFLASLCDLYTGAKESLGFPMDQLDPAFRIELEQEQQKLFFTLPKEIQDYLKANYGNGAQGMPRAMIVHKGLVI